MSLGGLSSMDSEVDMLGFEVCGVCAENIFRYIYIYIDMCVEH